MKEERGGADDEVSFRSSDRSFLLNDQELEGRLTTQRLFFLSSTHAHFASSDWSLNQPNLYFNSHRSDDLPRLLPELNFSSKRTLLHLSCGFLLDLEGKHSHLHRSVRAWAEEGRREVEMARDLCGD